MENGNDAGYTNTGSIPIEFKLTVTHSSEKEITWKKVSSAQKIKKYELHYREKGTAKWKTKTYGASASSATIKNLIKGKKYEVQIRSLQTVSKVKYYSAWSGIRTSGKIK